MNKKSEGPCESLINSPKIKEVMLNIESNKLLEEIPPNHAAAVWLTLPTINEWPQEGTT